MPLTAKAIEKAKAPKAGHVEFADGVIGGLRLRVSATGRKAFILSTRVRGRLRRKMIGEFPAITLAEARTRAGALKDDPGAWTDPEPTPAARRARDSFGALAERYIKRECPRLKRGAETESVIRRELLRHWCDLPATEIRKRDAIRLIDAALDRGTPSAAFRLHETIKRVFSWALDRDEIDADPVARLRPPFRKEPRQRVLNDDEIRAIWTATAEIGLAYGPAVRMLVLTGQRLREVADMSWPEVNFEAADWTLPPERTKSSRPHIVPLNEDAMAILASLPRWDGGGFVFTTRGGVRPISGFSKFKARIDAISGVSGWRLHDIRRTVRTRFAELGVPEIISEHIMAHGPRDPLVRTYNVYQYRDEKRDALERWAQRLREIVEPPPANVVPMRTTGGAT